MKLKCIIIDDIAIARRGLEDYIHKIPSLELIGSFYNAFEALESINSQMIDLIFLDVNSLAHGLILSAYYYFRTIANNVIDLNSYAMLIIRLLLDCLDIMGKDKGTQWGALYQKKYTKMLAYSLPQFF